MSRPARHAALSALVALIGCSVYDASLLVGGLGASGGAAHGNGGDGGGGRGPLGGTGSATAGSGATSGSVGESGGTGGSNGGSSDKGGSGASSGNSSGGSTGGSSTGGSSRGGSSDGGTDTSTGGSTDGGSAGVGEGGAADGGTTSTAGGTGGSVEVGGSGGAAGATGGTSGGTGGGGAGMAGTGGTGGAATASGCAALSAGLAATTDNTHYVITLGSTDVDLTNAVIDVHVYAKGSGGGLFMYLQEATYEFWAQPLTSFGSFDGWTTLHWDLAAETSTGTLDKATVRRLGIEITGNGGSAWTNPTVVYVDSITVTTPALSFAFGDTTTVNATPASSHTGDTALWLNNSSSDTTATGSTLAWVTSCP